MAKIDISGWKEFRIGDLFAIHPTKAYKLTNAQILDGGDTPVLANSAYNNGIGGYSTQNATESGNMVTFSDTVDANTIFYQPDDFVGYPHVQGLYPIGKYKDCWSEYNYLFFVSVFRKKALTKGFDYGNKFRRDIAMELHIKLPAASDGKPDFAYMDSYMRKIMKESEKRLDNLNQADIQKKKRVDTAGWKEFWLRDLFLFRLPQGDLQVKQVEEGDTPLVTPSAFNNGLLQKISSKSKSTLFSANTLTVDMFGNVYYQEEDYFVTAHGHVNVLIPKISLNKNRGMFISTVIRSMFLKKYGFSEMCTLKVLKAEKIMLPVASNGTPDLDYMDSYMKKIMKESEESLDNLNQADMQKKKRVDTAGWKEFSVGDLFQKLSLGIKNPNFNKALDVSEVRTGEFNIPLVNAKHGNNGIMYYGRDSDFETAEMTIDIVSNGAIATGDVYAQPQKTGVLWDAYLIKCVYDIKSELILLFLACVIKKYIKQHFAWNNKCVWNKVRKKYIKLPVNELGEPDFQYMEYFMKSIQDKVKFNLENLLKII